MAEFPETRYAQSDLGPVAYQVVGSGPVNVLALVGMPVPVDVMWDHPSLVHALGRLSAFSRHAWMDSPGTGGSGGDAEVFFGLPDPAPLEALSAVLDAAGFGSAALVAFGTSGSRAAFYAATHPERVSALVIVGGCARMLQDDDYPWGLPRSQLESLIELGGQTHGTAAALDVMAPSATTDHQFRQWIARCQRLCYPPDHVPLVLRSLAELDVRQVLPAIHVPTLVIHRRNDAFVPVEHGRYLAEHIEGAAYIELAGDDHLFFVGDTAPMFDAIEEFLTGHRPQVEVDRVLATLLFVDMVASTERATELGDHEWRALLERYRASTREHLHRFRGREINTRGDDFLATFDGPARAIRCALALDESAASLGVAVRIGLHTGEVELMDKDIGGIAVHIGARISERAGPGEVLVSSTVSDLVAGSGIEFADRGEHELKGVPGSWRLFAVEND